MFALGEKFLMYKLEFLETLTGKPHGPGAKAMNYGNISSIRFSPAKVRNIFLIYTLDTVEI